MFKAFPGAHDWDAEIINIEDKLAGDSIASYLDAEHTDEYVGDTIVLKPGEHSTLYYQELVESKIAGNNEVTVTTTVREYSAESVEVVWGDPAEELLDVVNSKDVSGYFGEEELGTLDAADLDKDQKVCFDYDYFFEYGVYDGPADRLPVYRLLPGTRSYFYKKNSQSVRAGCSEAINSSCSSYTDISP